MTPRFLRTILAILAVRAIFISPSQGSDCAPSLRKHDSALHKADVIRPSRLRFTRPGTPLASQERLDCIDGGDDDERTPPEETSVVAWLPVVVSAPPVGHRIMIAGSSRTFVRLRC